MRLQRFSYSGGAALSSSIFSLTTLTSLKINSASLTAPISATALGTLVNLQELSLRGMTPARGGTPISRYLTPLTHPLSILTPTILLSSPSAAVAACSPGFVTIPAAISSLSALTSLALTWCSLIGNLPPVLFTLPSLQSLDLTYNALNGTLSPALGNLNQLSSLSLTSNNLTGPFPLSLGTMKSLSVIELSGNYFVGSVPNQAVPWALAATQGYLNVEDNCQLAPSSMVDVGTQARCLKSKSSGSTPPSDQYTLSLRPLNTP